MKRLFFLFCAITMFLNAKAQNTIHIFIKDAKTGKSLTGATILVPQLNFNAITDSTGGVKFNNIPKGKFLFQYQFVGYTTKSDSISFPNSSDKKWVHLEFAEDEEIEEVVITTTRSSRTIAKILTRIEVIAGEELDEKSNMKPGDIRMVLNESTGIQTQQTSATSANASIRIQGLDGRYTQILKDGFPLFSGAANGLGLLQTPPLDLKQVEVIKGSASTLYGGGAIAGLVDLVSKTPKEKRELNFHFNGTTAGGLDANGYYAQKMNKIGITVFAAHNSNSAFAPGNEVLTAIPKFNRYTLNPKIYFYISPKTSLNVGINSSIEKRIGGDINVVNNKQDLGFYEHNYSERFSNQIAFKHQMAPKKELNIRSSVSYFNRDIGIPDYEFKGNQWATFTEINYSSEGKSSEWITGINILTDQFNEKEYSNFASRDYNQTTFGAFVQNTNRLSSIFEMETGLRSDMVSGYGVTLLPRISVLFKPNNQFNSRIGGGLGYKAPTIFTEESERIQYQQVLPISTSENKLEKSYGLNWDFTYRKGLFNNAIAFSVNHLFFYTFLNNPLMLESGNNGTLVFKNQDGHMDSRGMETNVKLAYDDFKLFLGYSFTDTRYHSGDIDNPYPLTAKHRLNNVLMYEVDEKWKLGLEAYYYGKQKLNDETMGRSYWITGFMAEKLWERFSIYINFENFTNVRQSKFAPIYTGSLSNPTFKDIYAPLDGFVANGGIKFKL